MVGTFLSVTVNYSLVVNCCGNPLRWGSEVPVLLDEVVIERSFWFVGLNVSAFIQSNPLLRLFAGLCLPLNILTIVLRGSMKD